MGSIGLPELIVMVLILAMLVVPVVILIWLLKKRNADTGDLVPCRACGRRVSPRALTCPQCGEPRATT